MSNLIACLSTGKGTWGHVNRLIEDESWSQVILITNDFGKENFNKKEGVEFITVDTNKGLKDLREEIQSNLKDKIKDDEIRICAAEALGIIGSAEALVFLRAGLKNKRKNITKTCFEQIENVKERQNA